MNGSDFADRSEYFEAIIRLLFSKRYSPGIKFVRCDEGYEV